MIDCTIPKTYWIVFKSTDGWYAPVFKKNFSHCLILTQDKFNWYICDPTSRRLIVKILSYDPKYNLPNLLRKEADKKVIRITMNNPSHTWIPNFSCISCVTMIKYILNLNIIAFTPWHLYKRLKRLRTNIKKQSILGINSITLL